GRDQRASVANPDPPHEVDDREAPGYRDVDAPDADATNQQPRDGPHQHQDQQERDRKADVPTAGQSPRKDDRADLVGDRSEALPRSDKRSKLGGWRLRRRIQAGHRAWVMTDEADYKKGRGKISFDVGVGCSMFHSMAKRL